MLNLHFIYVHIYVCVEEIYWISQFLYLYRNTYIDIDIEIHIYYYMWCVELNMLKDIMAVGTILMMWTNVIIIETHLLHFSFNLSPYILLFFFFSARF